MARSARSIRAGQLEAWLAAGAPKGNASLEIIVRDCPGAAILTAVHAVRHWRFGAWKYPDRFTGPLAIEAARYAECRALVVGAPSYEDSNHDEETRLKSWLRQIAARPGSYVLDVHGMKAAEVEIVIGTASGATPRRLVDIVGRAADLSGFSYRVADEGLLSGGSAVTIAAWSMRELGVPAVQLELAPSLRDPAAQPLAFDRAVRFLGEVARDYRSE